MLLLCDDTAILPLRIIFRNILSTAIYPDMWKVAPIFKKGDKRLIKTYRQISLLPICGKMFEKIIFNNLYNHLITHHLITKHQSGFELVIPTTIQLIDLATDIYHAFDITWSSFLEAFDNAWHAGIIIKMRQNGVSCRLLILFKTI